MNYKDGFVAMHAELFRQLAFAPAQPESFDAEGFFAAYGGHETAETLREQIGSSVQSRFEDSQENEDEEDRFESIDDVEADALMRARVYDNGDLHIYDCDPDHQGGPDIGPDEEPVESFCCANVYRPYGLDEPRESTPEP